MFEIDSIVKIKEFHRRLSEIPYKMVQVYVYNMCLCLQTTEGCFKFIYIVEFIL